MPVHTHSFSYDESVSKRLNFAICSAVSERRHPINGMKATLAADKEHIRAKGPNALQRDETGLGIAIFAGQSGKARRQVAHNAAACGPTTQVCAMRNPWGDAGEEFAP